MKQPKQYNSRSDYIFVYPKEVIHHYFLFFSFCFRFEQLHVLLVVYTPKRDPPYSMNVSSSFIIDMKNTYGAICLFL